MKRLLLVFLYFLSLLLGFPILWYFYYLFVDPTSDEIMSFWTFRMIATPILFLVGIVISILNKGWAKTIGIIDMIISLAYFILIIKAILAEAGAI